MKKYLIIGRSVITLLILTAIAVQTGCSSSKGQATANRKEIKGSWVLNSISYDGLATGAKYNIALLDESTDDCLQGSTWVLPNNGFGSYTLVSTAAGCTPGERKIVWSYRTIDGETIFQYKLLEDGVKAKKVTEGYRFKILSASEDSMQLQQETTAGGKTVYINYQFTSIK